MKTLVLLSCCPGHSVADWSPVINALPCIFWGIIALVTLFFFLKYVVAPLIANCHEVNLKKKASEQEQYWANRALTKEMVEKLKLSPDEWLKNQMNALTENIDKIAKELASEKDKEKKVIESLELRKKAYEEMLTHISTAVSLVSLEEKQVTDKKDGQIVPNETVKDISVENK